MMIPMDMGGLFPDVRSNSLTERGVFYLSDEINQSVARDVNTWILDSNFQQKRTYENLTLMITSPGGDLFSAFSIIDVMRASSVPIHTVGLGLIASAGLMIFISGQQGERLITPNTMILSHQWSAGSYGKEHELIAAARGFDMITKRVITHYRKCTKLSEKIVREKLLPPQDVWVTPEEALEYKLTDKVKDLQ